MVAKNYLKFSMKPFKADRIDQGDKGGHSMKPLKRNHLLIPSRYEDFFEKRALERYQCKNRKRLENKDFTIFANSCVGAQIYRDLNDSVLIL